MTYLPACLAPYIPEHLTPLAYGLTFLLLTLITPAIMPLLRRRNQLPVTNRLVLITGGSSGMGLSAARLLSTKGAHIVIIARDPIKLSTALTSIRASAASPSQRFHAISADMSISTEAARAFAETQTWWSEGGGEGGVDIVWQCAGGTQPGYFKDTSPEQLEAEVKGNYFGALHTAHNAIRAMTEHPATPQNKKHLIFTSSVLALYPVAGYSAYAPSKAAVRSLADGLRQECLLYDIAVHCCFPATIYSPGFAEENKTKPELTRILEGSDDGQTPDEVARVCVKRLEKGQFLVVTTILGEAMRGAAWGGSPRGCWVWDTGVAVVVQAVWAVVGKVLDWEVVKYRKKVEKAGGKFA